MPSPARRSSSAMAASPPPAPAPGPGSGAGPSCTTSSRRAPACPRTPAGVPPAWPPPPASTRTRRARPRSCAASRRRNGWMGCTCPPVWCAMTAQRSPSAAGPPTRPGWRTRHERFPPRARPVVCHPGDRAGDDAPADRQRAAGDPHHRPVRRRQVAEVPHRGPAPQSRPANRDVPGAARGHDRGRPVRVHPVGRGVHPVRLVVQGGLAEPGRGRARPAHRPGGDQPDQEPAGAPGLAMGPLGRLHLLAGRAASRLWRGHRPGHPVGVHAHHRLRRGGRRRGHLALRRCGPGGCPVTSIALDAYRAPELRLPRLLAGVSYYHPTGLAEHEDLYGPLPLPVPAQRYRTGRQRPEYLIDLVERSGLTGRGGAGFPTGKKMRSVVARRGRAIVVANGAEGEPASCKDRLLLTRAPHLILDGITLAAYAVGADEAHLVVHGQEADLMASLEDAIADRETLGVDPVPIQLTGLPARYVSSEQSSIVQYLSGGPAKPTFSPPRPHERGVKGRPTLVNNVETLAHLALIARYGDGWFRGVGTASAPGSTLVTVGGAVARPGVYEIEMGTPLGQVVMMAGGPSERLQALLVGGYFGAWLPAEFAWPVPMAHADLRAVGGAMGAGMVIALPVTACALAETARVVSYLAEETAVQCGPCMFGLPALADTLIELAYQGGWGGAIKAIATLVPLIEKRGACRHPDGATQLVRSALTAFAADARWHDRHGPCHGVGRAPLLPIPSDEEREWDWT